MYTSVYIIYATIHEVVAFSWTDKIQVSCSYYYSYQLD